MPYSTDKPCGLLQAVILAGGRGVRLGSLTDARPKPMIDVNGSPFLQYLIEDLRDQGIDRVLLLLGYKAEVIQDWLGDGSALGVDVSYSVTAIENETGQRLRRAESLLDQRFLLMYCDNYLPLNLSNLWAQYQQSGAEGQITVYGNKDGYTKSNVRIDSDGRVVEYDKSRTAPDLSGVDVGYAMFDHSVLRYLPDENVSFEAAVYPKLVEAGSLTAYVTDHRYYSIGSPDRLAATERFFRRAPTVILDRDGVLNRKPPKAEYVKTWDEFEWLPGAREALALLKRKGYRTIILTNQAGVARGVMTESSVAGIHANMRQEAEAAGGRIDAVYHCPHGWDDGCACRKPKPGMLFDAQRDFDLDLHRTVFVGDDERDEQAGEAAGCPTVLVSAEYPLLQAIRERVLSGEET